VLLWNRIGFDNVFGPEAVALDEDDLGVVQQAVEERRGEGRIVVEYFCPALERPVGREGDRAALITLGDDLEEQIGAEFVDRKISNFIELRYA
jgi:hypothetical protein